MNRSRYQFNLAMNEEEHKIVHKLKEDYDINVSGCFKRFLRQKLAEQEKVEYEKEKK